VSEQVISTSIVRVSPILSWYHAARMVDGALRSLTVLTRDGLTIMQAEWLLVRLAYYQKQNRLLLMLRLKNKSIIV